MSAGYREAIRWIAYNDDSDLGDTETGHILTVCLVADLFRKTEAMVASDVRKYRLRGEDLKA